MDKGAPLGVGIAWVLLMGGIMLKGCHDDNDDLCEAACYPHKVVQCDVKLDSTSQSYIGKGVLCKKHDILVIKPILKYPRKNGKYGQKH